MYDAKADTYAPRSHTPGTRPGDEPGMLMTEQTPAERIKAEARAATRRALLEAGIAEVVASGGIDVPTIDAVCARAGYTRGAFYFYFEDREQFFSEMLEWLLTNVIGTLFQEAAQEATGVDEIIERFTRALAEREWPAIHGDVRAGYLSIMRGVQRGGNVRKRHAEIMSGVIDQLENAIERGQTDGELRGDVDPRGTASMLLLSAVGAVLWDGIDIDIDPKALRDAMRVAVGTSGVA